MTRRRPTRENVRLFELFEQQADRNPAAVAVVCEGRSQTYGEVEAEANRVAQHLHACGVKRGDLVAVCLNRTLSVVPALLGILKAGAAYVPLEPTYPKVRVEYILQSQGIRHVVTQSWLLDSAAEWEAPSLTEVTCLDAGGEAPAGGNFGWRLWLERDVAKQPAERPAVAGSSEDLAYIIFTSGSTGTPKGVMVRHRPGGQPDRLGQPDVRGGRRGPGAVRHLALLRPVGVRHLRPAGGGRARSGWPRRQECAIPSGWCELLRDGAGHLLGLGAGGAAAAAPVLPRARRWRSSRCGWCS